MVHKNILHYQSVTNRIRFIHVEEGRKKRARRKDNFFSLSLDRKKEIYKVNLPREREKERKREEGKERKDKKMLRVKK